MTDQSPPNWEPDPQKMGNWRSMFEQPRRDGQPPGEPSAPSPPADMGGLEDEAARLDLREYHPWTLQRVRTRPTMMLELRRYESRSGLWQGWVMSYPSLQAVEYMGERMLSLDFGSRKFMLEGEGLAALTGRLQQGIVVAIQEYSNGIWPHRIGGPIISAIRRIGFDEGGN